MFSKKKEEELKIVPENQAIKVEDVKTVLPEKSITKSLPKEMNEIPSQRDIVYSQICELLKNKKLVVKKNQPVMEIFNNELLELLYLQVSGDFTAGKATLKDTPANKEKLNDPKKLRAYVKGLCANWLRRDPRLNGDEEFKLQ